MCVSQSHGLSLPKDQPNFPKHGHAGGAASNPQRTGAPAKGDSTPSGPPFDPGSDESDASPLPLDGSTPIGDPNATLSDGPATPATGRNVSGIFVKGDALQPGDVLGGRYEILQLLGEGGMGSVYKAKDVEIDRFVALKLIRPDLASNPAILARFKQELMTAHQVTHKNVIRIYDLAEAANIKFITMEYVEGSDLRRILLDNGKMPAEKAVQIIRQVCLALDAAHSAGVIHRDLKPQNIMQDRNGRILVMDFGLARSLVADGMTQTGMLLGTIEYMSPEQAMGKELDGRSDIFALGLILYELLTGKMPYRAETAMASLLKRNQERAIPVAELEPSIPKGLSDIVGKCLERDLTLRYQSAQEILTDLEAWQGNRPTRASLSIPIPVAVPATKRALAWKWIGASALALVLGAGGWMLRGRGTTVGANGAGVPQASLAILPFHNATTDLSVDWIGPSLADMLSTDVGQSSRMHIVSTDRLHQILKDLRIAPNAVLDTDTLRHIAELSSADTVVWGQYAKYGEQIRIDATLLDLKRNQRAPLKIEAASEKEIPKTVDGLADLIRKNLSVSSDVMKELKSSSFQPTSKSVPALRDYNHGVQLFRDGKSLEAVKVLEAATQEDPEFALAYSRLGLTYAGMGYDDKAEQFSRKATSLAENLQPREKYLILANHARITNDSAKAIEAYENLIKASPDDPDVQFALGELYETTGELDKARTEYAKVLARDPKQVEALLTAGRVEVKSDNPQGGLEYLNRALNLAVQLGNDEEKAKILQGIGISYKLMNKLDDALRNYQESLAIKRRLGQKGGMSASLGEIAQIQRTMGKPDAALASFNEALQLSREIGDKQGTAITLNNLGTLYVDRGNYDQALRLFKESLQLERDAGDETGQALPLNNIGHTYFSMGDFDNARTYFEQALRLSEKFKNIREISDAVHNLAETSLKMGEYGQAQTQYLRALDLRRNSGDKRGAAMESSGMATLFDYQGRYGAGVAAQEEALTAFRDAQDRSYWMAFALSGYGHALSQVGRYDEAQKNLADALSLARELKNQSLSAQTLNYQGDSYLYRGEFKAARPLYNQALQEGTRAKDRNMMLLSKINLAGLSVREGHSQMTAGTLKGLAQEADRLGLKYLSAECSVFLGETLLRARQSPAARQELETAVRKSEKLSSKALLAQSHHLLAQAVEGSGNAAESARHSREARRLLEEIRTESRSDAIVKREDLRRISADAAGKS